MSEDYKSPDLTPEQSEEFDRLDDQAYLNPIEIRQRLGLGATATKTNVGETQVDSGKSSYREDTPYKGRHPIKLSPRTRTVGDANSGDPHLR